MVDLPLPLSPASATISRSPMASVTSSTACRVRRDSAPPILKCLRQALGPQQRLAAPGRRGGPCGSGHRGLSHRRSYPVVTAGSGPSTPSTGYSVGPRPAGSWSMTRGQRGANRQPAGGRARSGGLPRDPGQRHLRPADGRERVQQARAVRVLWRVEDLAGGARSATWPAYITISRSEKWLTSDMSWVTKMIAKPSSLLQLLDLHHQRALGHHVQGRGRLVHDHQLGGEQHGHRDHGPLPHPAGQLVRVALQVHRVDADHAQHLGRPVRDLAPRAGAVGPHARP